RRFGSVRHAMTVGAERDEVCLWINDVTGSKFGHRRHMMHFDKPGTNASVFFGKIKIASTAARTVDGERRSAVPPVAFVAVDLNQLARSFGKRGRKFVCNRRTSRPEGHQRENAGR